MTRCEVRLAFYDLVENVTRKPGDVFTCKDDRAKDLEKSSIVDIICAESESKEAKSPKTTRKKA